MLSMVCRLIEIGCCQNFRGHMDSTVGIAGRGRGSCNCKWGFQDAYVFSCGGSRGFVAVAVLHPLKLPRGGEIHTCWNGCWKSVILIVNPEKGCNS